MPVIKRIARWIGVAVLVLLVLVGGALVTTQTGWFKNYLRGVVVRQAAQYLNGTLTIEHLRGTVLTGIELDGVSLQHEGQSAIVIPKLTLGYHPITLIREGLVLTSLNLDRPTVLLQRDDAGWNFNRFVKTRKNTGGKGAPPLTIQALNIDGGHVIVKDHGTLLQDISDLNSTLRFAYQKPGIEFDISRLTGHTRDVNIRKLAGNLRFEGGGTQVGDLGVQTDRSDFVTTFGWAAGNGSLMTRPVDITFHGDRVSLPEIGIIFKPVSTINLAPKVDVKAHGTFQALAMEVNVQSPDGNAHGPLVGHFAGAKQGLEGTLDVQAVDLEHMINRKEWATRVTGRTRFNWQFGRPTAVGAGQPMRVNFSFEGPEVQGFGYRASNVRTEGEYVAPDLKFTGTGSAYGASASTRASFHFPATGPMSYSLAGRFYGVDMRALPASLALPRLETKASGEYQFASDGHNWRGSGTLSGATVEGAQFADGSVFEIDAQGGALHYSASGNVTGANPERFAGPLKVDWLADERLRGLLTGSFTFEGSGRNVDTLVLNTAADLTDSTIANAHFPQAHVTMEMSSRRLSSTFAGSFEQLPGSLFTTQQSLSDAKLNGSANASVAVTIPAVGPAVLETFDGTAQLTRSTVAGLTVDNGHVDASYVNDVADIRQLSLTGESAEVAAHGTLALGDTGQSNLQYDATVTDLRPLGGHFGETVSGGAHVTGQATGPASQLTLNGTVEANRFAYGTSVEALSAKSTYAVTLADWNLKDARVQADTTATFVTLAGQNIPQFSAKTTYRAGELGFETSLEQPTRSLGLTGRVLLHPDHHEVHLQALNLAVGQTRWSLPPGREATAQYSPTSITIDEFVLQRGTEQFAASGTVAIGAASETMPNNLTVKMDNVQARDINELMLGQRQLDGLINATAQITGTRSDPRVQADFSVVNGDVQGVTFESFAGKAQYQDKAATVDVRLQQNPQAFLTAVGTVPVPNGPGSRTGTENMDLAIKSSPIDVALFQPATTQLTKLSGQLEADLRVGGTFQTPTFDGQLNVTNAGFTVPATAVVYSNALARLTFEGDHVLVDRFEVSDNDKDRLVAIGQLGIAKRTLGAMNVQISAQQFKVLDNQFGHVEVDTDLRITGDASKPQIQGTLSSQNGRLEVDQLLEQLTKNPYSTQATVATTTETPANQTPSAAAVISNPASMAAAPALSLYDAATVDVQVILPDDLVLRGRDMQTTYSRIGLGNMNITVGGDLNIRKAVAGEPDIVGTVSVVRGFYEFQGRRFEVLRDSVIRFQGLRPVDPALQVDAQRVISGVTAVVNIRGTARQPLVQLTSRPPMDEADVLSLIVFNQPINQLGEGERVNLAQRAGSMAAGYIASPIANSIADALDLDLFEIRPEGGVNGQPSVALGQQFGSRLFVQFKQEFGSSDRSELSFEYRIHELLRLVSTVAQGTQQIHRTQRVDSTGGDLIFVLSY